MHRKILSALGFVTLLSSSVNAESIQEGKTIYNQTCFACHGPDLKGGIGPSLIDDYWKHGDSPQAILQTISNGIPNSEMVPYKHLFDDHKRQAVRDFVLSKQEGLRSLVLSTYPGAPFKNKRFTPELFTTFEASSENNIKENRIFFANRFDGISHLQAKLHLTDDATYQFKIKDVGRTSVFFDGKEVFYYNEEGPKSENFSKELTLKKGDYPIVIMHEEESRHALLFHAVIIKKNKGHIKLMGRSLEGSEPKLVRPSNTAKVIRKYIQGISPRTLLCLLPNKTLVAYNPNNGKIEGVWKNSHIDQTPSLNSRSASPSEIIGEKTKGQFLGFDANLPMRFLNYKTEGDKVIITSAVGGIQHQMIFSPLGQSGFTINGLASGAIPGFKLSLSDGKAASADAKGNFSLSFK